MVPKNRIFKPIKYLIFVLYSVSVCELLNSILVKPWFRTGLHNKNVKNCLIEITLNKLACCFGLNILL